MAKILLVEDDNNLREIYEARLQAEGYQIVSAQDGEQALVVAKSEKPDLVISDVMMPKISGFEMLDILRNTDELKGVKVIMLTALGQSDDQQRADKLGADRYLVKSQVTLEDIVNTAHELLGDQAGGDTGSTATATTAPTASPADTATQAPAPEPAPEPAPAPAPAPEPAPEPSTPTTGKPEPDESASKEAAEPTAKEEAAVEAKIEDFVAGATSEPSKPTGPGTAANSDDKLMSDAVDTLVASTGQQDTPKATPIPVSIASSDDDKPAPVTPPAEPAQTSSGEGGSKKVIKPLDSKPKKDINKLLAEEEAKESQTVPGATISAPGAGTTEPEDKPAGAPMPPPSSADDRPKPAGPDPADPNSIAL